MPMLNSNEKARMLNLARSGDLPSQAWVDHEEAIVKLRSGLEGRVMTARCSSTANRALTGLTALDGVTPVAGDIVLLKDQTDAKQNGLYKASATAWSRLTDVNGAEVLKPGLIVVVQEGTANGDKQFLLTNNNPIVLGTDNITFVAYALSGVTSSAFNKITLTAAAEADNAIVVTGQVTDMAGTNVSSTKEVLVRTLAVTADKGDITVTVGTSKKVVNPTTGENVAWVTTNATGGFAISIANDQAENVLVQVTSEGALAALLSLTFA